MKEMGKELAGYDGPITYKNPGDAAGHTTTPDSISNQPHKNPGNYDQAQ